MENLAACLLGFIAPLLVQPALLLGLRDRYWARMTDIYASSDFEGTIFLLARALSGEHGPETTLLSWPHGFSLGSDFPNTGYTDAMAVGISLLGQPTGYNLAILLTLALNGSALHLLARALGARPLPALLAATLASTTPIILDEALSGRPVTAYWALPLYGLALCLFALRSWRLSLLAVPGLALLVASVLHYPYQLLILSPLSLLLPWRALRLGREGIARLLTLGALSLATLLPVLYELGGRNQHLIPVKPFVAGQTWSLLALFGFPVEVVPMLRLPGLLLPSALLLALLVLCSAPHPDVRQGRADRPTLILLGLGALALLVMSLGSNLVGFAGRTDPGMPYVRLLESQHWLWGCPRATRYAMGAALVVTLGWGLALSMACDRIRRPTLRLITAGLSFFAVILGAPSHLETSELLAWPPLPAMELMADQAILLDLPIDFTSERTQMALYGVLPVPRLSPPASDRRLWRERLSLYGTPLLLAATVIGDGDVPSDALKSALRPPLPEVQRWGLDRVAVHRKAASSNTIQALERLLSESGFEAMHAEPSLSIWRPLPMEPRDH